MSPESHDQLADQLEQQADQLEQHGDEVAGRIEETRQEWDHKRADESVPGANPPPQPASDDPANEDEGTETGGPAGVGEPGSSGRDTA